MSPILITGDILGQMKLTKPQAENAAKLFGLSKNEQTLLNEVPFRGTGTLMPPTDPLIYRCFELIMVNGPALKALKGVDRRGIRRRHHVGDRFRHGNYAQSRSKGDRVSLGMTGKFLPYKYYGATGNALVDGLKED